MTSKAKPSELYLNAVPLQRANSSPHQRREKGRPIAAHKFEVGQALYYSPSVFEPATLQGIYRVVRLLPADGGDNQYRLKSESDGHERVVREGQVALR